MGELADLYEEGRVRSWEQEGLSFFVNVPAGANTGFHVHAWPEHGQVSFGITVEVDDSHRQASLALHEKGFELDEPTGWYTTHLTDDVLTNDEDPAFKLLEFVEGDITKLVASRFLAPSLTREFLDARS